MKAKEHWIAFRKGELRESIETPLGGWINMIAQDEQFKLRQKDYLECAKLNEARSEERKKKIKKD